MLRPKCIEGPICLSLRMCDAGQMHQNHYPHSSRQWGSDTRVCPLPAYPDAPTDTSLTLSRLAILVTVGAWLAYVVTTIIRQFVNEGTQSMRFSSEAVSYLFVVTLLSASALAYLVARHGHLIRARDHRRVPRAVIDEYFSGSMPTLTVLIPSYREDARVVRQTLLSAALQEYPFQRIVLLIDDPPNPSEPENQAILAAAEALPLEIEQLLAVPRARAEAALCQIEQRAESGDGSNPNDIRFAIDSYSSAVDWLEELVATIHADAVDHTDVFLAEHVVGRLAADLEGVKDALEEALDAGETLSIERLLQLHRRLLWTFRTELTSFQRKRYSNLSNEPNKAMNLNSYLGLAGGAYREVAGADGTHLVPARTGHRDLVIPDPDYVLTLDADSVLLPEYCLRLVYLMQQRESQDIAVAQTPYSAFPGSPTRLERLAGATTDLQHNLHQGMTHYDATFWVGANAVLRKAALDDIVEVDRSGGVEVHRFIQDRTVIEDTESSIDLVEHGWKLYNYPERLSYSATPPDFGSLAIQRERWANGGLLIFPKLLAQVRRRRTNGKRTRPGELFLRTNYMASIAWANFGLVMLLTYPYNDQLLSPLVVLAAAPYFLAMASDLKKMGYKRTDVARIYGFNLLLLAVNLSGVFSSIRQAVTGRKIPFRRTPKVKDRTTADLWVVVVPFFVVAFSLFTFVREIGNERWGHAIFAGTNAILTLYAVIAFVGLGNAVVDIFTNIADRLYKKECSDTSGTDNPELATPAWSQVLHYGSIDLHSSPAAHEREVLRLRNTRVHPRLTPATHPDEVVHTMASTLDALAVGENLTIYRDKDGFRVNRSGRPIPTTNDIQVEGIFSHDASRQAERDEKTDYEG